MKSVTSKRSTRDIILHTIKAMNQATVEELAVEADVSPVTVRHHLNALLADGLIETESVRRHVGRPYYIYSLTEAGHELFPKKYFALSMRLLEELKARFPQDLVNEVFEGVVRRVAEDHRGEYEHLSFEARLDYLVRLLAEEGFLAKWEKVNDDQYQLIEYSCPFLLIGQQHEEVCKLDTTLIQTVMQTPVEQHSCMLNGDSCCQFTVSAVAPARRQPQTTITLTEVQTL